MSKNCQFHLKTFTMIQKKTSIIMSLRKKLCSIDAIISYVAITNIHIYQAYKYPI